MVRVKLSHIRLKLPSKITKKLNENELFEVFICSDKMLLLGFYEKEDIVLFFSDGKFGLEIKFFNSNMINYKIVFEELLSIFASYGLKTDLALFLLVVANGEIFGPFPEMEIPVQEFPEGVVTNGETFDAFPFGGSDKDAGKLNFIYYHLYFYWRIFKKQVLDFAKRHPSFDENKVEALLEAPSQFSSYFTGVGSIYNVLNNVDAPAELIRAGMDLIFKEGFPIDSLLPTSIGFNNLAILYKTFGEKIPEKYYGLIDKLNISLYDDAKAAGNLMDLMNPIKRYIQELGDFVQKTSLETMSSIEKELYYFLSLENNIDDFKKITNQMKQKIDAFKSLRLRVDTKTKEELNEETKKRVRTLLELLEESKQIKIKTYTKKQLTNDLLSLELPLELPKRLRKHLKNRFEVLYKFINRYGEDWIFAGFPDYYILSGSDVEWDIEKTRVTNWMGFYKKNGGFGNFKWIMDKEEMVKKRVAITKLISLNTGKQFEELWDFENGQPDLMKNLLSEIFQSFQDYSN